MTTHQITSYIKQALAEAYPEGEVRAFVRILFEEWLHYSTVDIYMRADCEVPDFVEQKMLRAVERLLAHEPIQHIVGVAHFHGHRFKVDRHTLIPRPETEQLVDMIIDQNPATDLRVLDIGTGSGCIAIALSRALPFARIDACDISAEALDVARDNARQLRAAVDFFQCDILHEPLPDSPLYDVIVSNPPYIARSEAAEIEPRVLDFEPHSALFVDDADPLLFYRTITRYARAALRPEGTLYFEINPLFAKQLVVMLHAEGFARVDVQRDYCGRQRFAIAQR